MTERRTAYVTKALPRQVPGGEVRGSALEVSLAFQIAAAELPEPVREYRFHPVRRWRFDFAWPGCLVAAEVEGGQWVNGRHVRGGGFEGDAEKYNEAALLGWTVFRFTRQMVERGDALRYLGLALGTGGA
jgi:very-short-patch-repair endonuclease